ncbi:MAG: NADH-quinone oxidoreductase subunit M [Planctomycetales bacterium]
MLAFLTTLLDNVVFLMALLPLVGAALALASARMGHEAVRRAAFVNVLLSCGLAIAMVAHFRTVAADAARPQMVTSLRWLAAVVEDRVTGPDVRLTFGVDGLSLWLIAMTPFVMLPALALARDVARERPALFHALLLGAEASAIATFAARDVALFLIGLETTLLLSFLLLGGWGGYDRRAAARKFLLYNLAGGLLIATGLLGVVLVEQRMRTGGGTSSAAPPPATFDYGRLFDSIGPAPGAPAVVALARSSERRAQRWASVSPWVFLALLVGFAIRAGTFPFHTWLTAANLEAAPAASVFLTAVQLKLGVYGLLRFVIPLFPELCRYAAGAVIGLGVCGAAYGGLLAIAQGDLKKLATYVCIADVGLCIAGLFSLTEAGVVGAALLLAAHGLAIAMFLYVVGLLERRYRTRDIEPFGGLAARHPRLAAAVAFAALALAGAPGLGGFLGETLVLLGVYRGLAGEAAHLMRTAVALAATLLVAWALLGMIGRVLRGRFREPGRGTIFAEGEAPPVSRLPAGDDSVVAIPLPPRAPAAPADAAWRDLWPVLPLAAVLAWMGIAPQFFIDRLGPAVGRALGGYSTDAGAGRPETGIGGRQTLRPALPISHLPRRGGPP